MQCLWKIISMNSESNTCLVVFKGYYNVKINAILYLPCIEEGGGMTRVSELLTTLYSF